MSANGILQTWRMRELFSKAALPFATFPYHLSPWNVWGSTSPVTIYANLLSFWEVLWGDTQCLGNLRAVWKEGGLQTLWAEGGPGSGRAPAASFQQVHYLRHWDSRLSFSLSLWHSHCCKVPPVGDIELKPCVTSPHLVSIQVLQPPAWWPIGPLFIPNVPKMWLQKGKTIPPTLYCTFPNILTDSLHLLLPPL